VEYVKQKYRISFDVDIVTYAAGDFCHLFTNAGAGAIGSLPHDRRKFFLVPVDSRIEEIKIDVTIATPGAWKFMCESYDSLGNTHSTGTPEEKAVFLALKPKAPEPPSITSYDFGLKQLVLGV
jgi:hypothetical protein